MNGRWGVMGLPNVLPDSYGEYTGGEFGRLAVMDLGPDTSVTTQQPYRTWDNSHGINRGDPNLPAYAASVPSLAPLRPPGYGTFHGVWGEANGEEEESWAAKQWRESQERRAKGEGWFQEGSTGRALLTSGVSLLSKDKDNGATFIPATTNGGGSNGGGSNGGGSNGGGSNGGKRLPGFIRGPGPRNLLAKPPPAKKAAVPWVPMSVTVVALGSLLLILRRRRQRK